MNYLFFLLVVSLLGYTAFKRPGIALAYVLIFQVLNKIIFEEVGLNLLRYSTTLLILLLVILLHFDRKRFNSNFNLLFRSGISAGYLVLTLYIVGYGVLIGTSYEYTYIQNFLVPAGILFGVGALLFFNKEMYKDLFYGIIFFSILTFIAIYLFRDFNAIVEVERAAIGDIIGVGPLTQARVAGVMGLFSILLALHKKGFYRVIATGVGLFALYWLALTGTRGGALSLIATLLFFIVFTSKRNKVAIRFIFIGILLLGALLFFNIENTPLIERTYSLTQSGEFVSTTRYYRWMLFFDRFDENLIFGLGPGGWGKHIMIGDYRYPHNLIIEAVIEFGLFGIFYVISVFGTAIYTVYKLLKSDHVSIYIQGIALSWIFYAVGTMTSGSLLTNLEFHTMSGIMVGLSYYYKYSQIEGVRIQNRKHRMRAF